MTDNEEHRVVDHLADEGGVLQKRGFLCVEERSGEGRSDKVGDSALDEEGSEGGRGSVDEDGELLARRGSVSGRAIELVRVSSPSRGGTCATGSARSICLWSETSSPGERLLHDDSRNERR